MAIEPNAKKEAYKLYPKPIETASNTEQLLKQLDKQGLLIKKLKEELKRAPWESKVDNTRD